MSKVRQWSGHESPRYLKGEYMSGLPDEIWVTNSSLGDELHWVDVTGSTQYTRTDIHNTATKRIKELEAEVASLLDVARERDSLRHRNGLHRDALCRIAFGGLKDVFDIPSQELADLADKRIAELEAELEEADKSEMALQAAYDKAVEMLEAAEIKIRKREGLLGSALSIATDAEKLRPLLNERDQLRELVKRLEYVCTDEDGCGYSLDASPEQHALIQQIQEKPDASKN
jgi:hypothetical protein